MPCLLNNFLHTYFVNTAYLNARLISNQRLITMHDFIFKLFDEMSPEDYETIGFKSGLEIHQQLLT